MKWRALYAATRPVIDDMYIQRRFFLYNVLIDGNKQKWNTIQQRNVLIILKFLGEAQRIGTSDVRKTINKWTNERTNERLNEWRL